MADVSININGTDERNGSVVVGAPRGIATSTERFGAGSNYTLLPGDVSDLGTGGIAKGAVGGVNDAPDVTVWDTKLTDRFDDVNYYTGG